ncbi:MAG: tryptophan synthase subunit alpha [Candidatus Omnitrophica bacterium 4484_70.2]|nr:MAG: tryptophan synthase subunit alpha [Candidatus Omnitrophica bacterium 4484_70.2]
MGRIEEKFCELRKKKKKAFIIFVPFGFPTIGLFEKIIKILDNTGIDFIEVGLPFSDPLADGVIIQQANQQALKEGATTQRLFSSLNKLREHLETPIIVLTYYNPVYVFGVRKFLEACYRSGVSGVMIVDLPVEEASSYIKEAKRYALDTIFFITPTTKLERMKKIISLSHGFIYYISVTGITGPKRIPLSELFSQLKKIKQVRRNINICVGFGIYKKSQVQEIIKESDGVIIGSAVVRYIKNNYFKKNFERNFSSYIKKLCSKL